MKSLIIHLNKAPGGSCTTFEETDKMLKSNADCVRTSCLDYLFDSDVIFQDDINVNIVGSNRHISTFHDGLGGVRVLGVGFLGHLRSKDFTKDRFKELIYESLAEK